MSRLIADLGRMMSVGSVALLSLGSPSSATAQSFAIHGAAGPTVVDAGYSLAAGIGVLLSSHFTVLVQVERTHLASRQRSDRPGSISAFRGGTVTVGAAELRVAPLGRDRVGPYGLAGIAVGQSRPNVNETFPNRVTNGVRAVFFGGGIEVPVASSVSVFADGRLLLGDESGEVLAVVPIRAGLSWRF